MAFGRLRRHARSLALLVFCCGAMAFAAAANALAGPLTWSAPVAVDGNELHAVSCPSSSLCVAVGAEGDIVTSIDPAGGAAAWKVAHVDGSFILNSISCPTTTLCVAGDNHGRVLTSTNPTGGIGAWTPVSVGSGPEAISCHTEALCVAVDASNNDIVSTNPTGGSLAWKLTAIDPGGTLYGISCPSLSLCVAADHEGNVLTSAEPTGEASAWEKRKVDGTLGLYKVSCPSTSLCVAVDDSGNVVTSTDPGAPSPTWAVSNVNMTNALFGVSCASASLCVATDFLGDVVTSTNPTGGSEAWTVTHVDGLETIYGVSCPTETMCVATDSAGNVLVGTGEGSGSKGGGSNGGGGGRGPGPSGPSGPPIAHLIVAPQKPGGSLALDGSASIAGGEAISGYRFKLSSASEELQCGPQAPIVHASFAGPTAGTATLTAFTARGASSTVSTPYATSGPKLVKRARRAATKYLSKQALVSAQCLPAAGSQPSTLTVGGKPVNAACEVHAGLVDAVGCGLHQVELCSGVPTAERKLLDAHINRYAGCFLNEVRGVFASRGHLASTQFVEKCAFHCVPVVDTYYVSTEPIRVNGLDMIPRPGAAIVLAVGGLFSTQFTTRHGAYLVTSSADVELGNLPLRLGLPFDYSVGAGSTSAHIADFDIKHPLPFLPEFSDLPLTGTLSADLVRGGATQIAANVGLPDVFTDEEGNGLTTSLTLRTDNVNGLYLNSFHLSIPNADLGEVAVEKAELDYSRAAATLEGKATIALPSSDRVSAEIGFLRGNFNKFHFDYMFGPGEGIEVFDGIYLTELFGGLRIDPTELDGGSRVSIGPSVTDQGCGIVDVRGNLTIHFGPLPFSIGGTGTNELLCQEVGTRYFHVDSDGHAEIGESVGFEIPSPDTGDKPPLAKVKGELKGQAYVDLKSRKFHFQFDGIEQAALNLFGLSGEYSAELVVSDLGFGVCAEINGPFGSKWHPGFGEDFAKVDPGVLISPPPIALALLVKNLDLEMDSCNIAQYRTLPGGAGAASVGHARTAAASSFTVPRGERTAIVALRGVGGAPNVILHGPGGRTIDATSAAPLIDQNELVLHAPAQHFTEIQIRGRNAGAWTIEAAPGSPAVAGVGVSHELAAPRIVAHVGGHGVRRILHYVTHVPAGTKVTFLEQGNGGSTVIGSTTRTKGQIVFLPSSAKAGKRTITAALLSPSGMPQPSIRVTSYTAAPPAPGRPGKLRLRHTRNLLLIGFTPAQLAVKHFVTVRLSDGRRLLFVLKGTHHSLVVRSVPAKVRVLGVRVRGEAFGRLGPVASK